MIGGHGVLGGDLAISRGRDRAPSDARVRGRAQSFATRRPMEAEDAGQRKTAGEQWLEKADAASAAGLILSGNL